MRTTLTAAACVFVLAACGGGNQTAARQGEGTGQPARELAGDVKVDGSSTVAPLATAAAELFAEQQAKVRVTVGTSGTGGGFEKFCNGETDISNASRQIEAEEVAACKAKGVNYAEFTVANDALTVVVHKDNTWATCLTVDQLKKMWSPGSKVTTWDQIDAKFPKEPLKLFGPGTDSGTFDYFTDVIVGEEGKSRTDYSPSEDDNVVVQGVAGTKGGLGYFGYTYFEENADQLKAVQIDSGGGCVGPSAQTAQDGTYQPLSRPLFIYPKAASLKRPEVLAFVEYFVANHKQIAEDAKFIPLNPEQEGLLQGALTKLKAAAGG
ncbi:PstS family phosphate ABC transporter substrate-binding protein [Nonomuraea sp. PA05]|nr:PstS family phosphate ABC transporter substrate-binding protein [Nonomuraea sp. PA05]